MKKIMFLSMLFTLLFIAGCGSEGEENASAETSENDEPIEVTVSAAASMTDAMQDIEQEFEAENPGIDITYNFGGSGTLRQQIEQGAPIDLFYSASKRDYDLVEQAGLVQEGEQILNNNLVMIKSAQSDAASFNAFVEGDGQLAVGTPEAVPAGTYAQQALESVDMWQPLEEQERLVLTRDVQQVLTLVDQGAVDAGIVYLSDSLGAENASIIEEIDSERHDPIEYYVADIEDEERNSEKQEAVDAFYAFTLGETAQAIFADYGFEPLHAESD